MSHREERRGNFFFLHVFHVSYQSKHMVFRLVWLQESLKHFPQSLTVFRTHLILQNHPFSAHICLVSHYKVRDLQCVHGNCILLTSVCVCVCVFSQTGVPSQNRLCYCLCKSTPALWQLRQHKTYLKVVHSRLEPDLKCDALSAMSAICHGVSGKQSLAELIQEGLISEVLHAGDRVTSQGFWDIALWRWVSLVYHPAEPVTEWG